MKNCKVVAEIGCCHLGSLDRAKELSKLAFLCGADYMKTQKRNPEESTPPGIRDKPHPNAIFAYGDTYLEHRKNLELSIEDHVQLSNHCSHIGIEYCCSVWDLSSARDIIKNINPAIMKVPSACNDNHELLKCLFTEYDGDIHISTGMTTRTEIENLIDKIAKYGDRVVLYHCTSEYPCPFEHLYLRDIDHLFLLVENTGMRIGFSNHGYGIASDIAAFTKGVEWIERHFVDDRTIKHTDAAASLEPEGLRKLCRDLKNVAKALEYSDGITPEEREQRDKLRVKHD